MKKMLRDTRTLQRDLKRSSSVLHRAAEVTVLTIKRTLIQIVYSPTRTEENVLRKKKSRIYVNVTISAVVFIFVLAVITVTF